MVSTYDLAHPQPTDWSLAAEAELVVALEKCEAQIATEPALAIAWQQRSYFLGRLGRYQDAVASYQKTLA